MIKQYYQDIKSKAYWFLQSKTGKNLVKSAKSMLENRHVINTIGGGVAGLLIASLTFLPLQLCITIGIVLGAYKSLTSN
jgi:hypothetical protein